MPVIDVRDSDAARQYLVQGLWLQRISAVDEQSVSKTLLWANELAASDEPIPPLGVVADIGNLVFGQHDITAHDASGDDWNFPPELCRAYEDYVLGKFYADATFERGSTAICRYADRDRDRGVAWLIARFRERSGCGGIRCSPSVLRTLAREPVSQLLAEGSESISEVGWMPWLIEHLQELVAGTRALGEVLAPEDVFELEHETALVEFGQRLALRQTLAVSNELQMAAPERAPRPSGRERNVTTNLHEEDSYPVGGFTSISTRGTIESLLHSQLAYMEPNAPEQRPNEPDLFDIKFLRSELLYYSRDENEFLRRRKAFVFALYPDLVSCRVRDAGFRYQRIIIILAVLTTTIRQLIDWLSEDSLRFEVVMMTSDGTSPLTDEQELCDMLLREQIENGTVVVHQASRNELEAELERMSRRSLTQVVTVSTKDRSLDADNILLTKLLVEGVLPAMSWDQESFSPEIPTMEGWQKITERLMRLLV